MFGRARSEEHQSLAKAIAMLAVLLAACYASFVLYTRANAGVPRSSFDGGVGISADVDGDQNGMDVEITVGKDAFADGLSHSNGSTRQIEIWIRHLNQEYAGKDVTVKLGDDARITNVHFRVIATTAHSTHDYVTPQYTEEVSSISPGEATQSLTVKMLPDHADYLIILNGTMAKPAAEIRGSEASLQLPECDVSLATSHCSVTAGKLGYGDSVIYSSRPQNDPERLGWEAEKSIYGVSMDEVTARIHDEYVSRSEQNKIFVAGAVIGIAANAGIELLLILAGWATTAVNRTTQRPRALLVRPRRKPLPASREPHLKMPTRRPRPK